MDDLTLQGIVQATKARQKNIFEQYLAAHPGLRKLVLQALEQAEDCESIEWLGQLQNKIK